MYIKQLDSGVENDTLQAQYNPEEVEVALQAMLNRHGVPLLGFQPIQSQGTGNLTTKFTMTFNNSDPAVPKDYVVQVINYFLASMYGSEGAGGEFNLTGQGRILFVWPGWIRLICVAPQFTFKVSNFQQNEDDDALPNFLKVDVQLEERRVKNIGRETVRKVGLKR